MVDNDDYRGSRFTRVDMSHSVLRDVDLTGARIIDALLIDADVSGVIGGLRVNGVEVAPLVEAELDRLHPERVTLRPTDPASLRTAWALVESMWSPTIELARNLPEASRQRRVDDEWSLVETLRHVIFVTAWFGRAVVGDPQPYHPLGLTPSFLRDVAGLGITIEATPTFEEVLAVREQRMGDVAAYLAAVTADDLAAPRRRNDAMGYPPPTDDTVLSCLRTVLNEEWHHHQYAVRDLSSLPSIS